MPPISLFRTCSKLGDRFINLALLAAMATVCAIVDSVNEHRGASKDEYWLYNDNIPGDNPSVNGIVTFANALITFQNVIPISLYISIEFVRTCQAAFIYFDYEMYYVKPGQPEESGQRTLARSWNLSDDLGQIEYVFSDKTGTLTQVRKWPCKFGVLLIRFISELDGVPPMFYWRKSVQR